MKSIINKILFFVICLTFTLSGMAQNVDNKEVSPPNTVRDSISKDSLGRDSLAKGYKISKDAVTSIVKYGAIDSNFTDVTSKEVHLFGNAFTDYETIKLKADYIVFNFGKNEVSAFEKRDTLPRLVAKPSFQDGETKAGFTEMRYNFESHKAIVKTLATQQSEFFVIGETSKYIGKENDTLTREDRFYNQNSIITTCNHPTPHFGIRARKMKFIPDKIAVLGPAQLEIAGIPTPIILPFGFFPLIKGQSSGLIFPSDFPYDNNYGFGIKGVGYYFPINDYVDATVTGDIWSRGSHALRVSGRYKKRYSYTGNVEISYANNILEDSKGFPTANKSFGLRVAHNQDAKAHPYRTLGGTINIETNRNSQRNNFDYANTTNNKLTSNFNYTYKWPESPFSFRAAFNHNQDNRTRIVNITLPDASLNMNTIQPFKRKNVTGDPLWYENIQMSYKAGLRSYVKTTDTTLFTQATLDNIQTGLSHGVTVSSNANVLKYFNFAPSMTYDEVYFLKTVDKQFDPNLVIDSIQQGVDAEGNPVFETRVVKYGSVQQSLKNDFEVFRKFSTSMSLQTNLTGIYRRNSGFFRGIRHVIKPNFSLLYSPATDKKYERYVDTDTRPEKNVGEYYNPLLTGPFPQSLNDEQFSITYGFNNVVDAKFRGNKDTVDKKVTLINNLDIGGSYNFARDSFQWSDVSIGGSTNLFKGYTNLQIRATLTPYEINYQTGRKINQLLINNKNNGRLLQMINFNAGINTSFSFAQLKDLFKKKTDEKNKTEASKKTKGYVKPSMTTLFDNLRFNHAMAITVSKTKTGSDSLSLSTHSLYINGSIPLSKNWNFNIGSISYDFVGKSLVYPSFGFSRDLHCWNMNFAWYPNSGVYSFFIGVKSGTLNFLKYDYNQPYIPRI